MREAEQGVNEPNDQMEQVQDEKAKLRQVLAELEHSTDEISQRAVAQQELVKNSHEEADTNVVSKQLPIQSCWWYVIQSSRWVGYLKVKSLSTLMCMKTADRH